MPVTKKRKTKDTKSSIRRSRKKVKGKKSSKEVANTVKIVENIMKNILDSRFKMIESLFKTTKLPEEWDYSNFDFSDDYYAEFQSRPSLLESYPNDSYKNLSQEEMLNIFKKDDSLDELNEQFVKINRLFVKFKSSTQNIDRGVIKFLSENEPKRTVGLLYFIDQFNILPISIDYNNMIIFHSFMLKMFMNPFNWLEDDINFDKRYKKNLLWILNKSEDYTINYISILNKYNEILEIENIRAPKYVDTIITKNTKKNIIKQFHIIGEEIISSLVKNIDNSSTFYTSNLKNIGISIKQFIEQDLIKTNADTDSQSYTDFFINNPLNNLTLNKSHTIKYKNIKAIYPPHLNSYFGIGKSGRQLQTGFENNHSKEFDNFPAEHRLYLFFKKTLDMNWLPNPTSNPKHEIEIRSYLQTLGFIGPKPNIDEDKKKSWYADQTLKIGEFVEQPNGGTAHPDLWVQLSNLRLSIEAKSNQGYYPMYGNTPPPKETVYIFSSKKTKYPNATEHKGPIRKKGRTTFTFGHHLLTDDIREIMSDSKQKINLEGKKLDAQINKTKKNFSTVGLSANANIQHIGKESNYWLDDRNLYRERQVLFYNWLEPEGICDTSVQSYTCENKNIFGNVETLKFECVGSVPLGRSESCECITHNEDFEQSDSFIGLTFSELEQMVYVDSFYYGTIPENSNSKHICHMCLMKYYTEITYEYYGIEEIKNIVLLNNDIFYNVVWKNYKYDSWLSEKNILDQSFENIELIKDFWENLTVYRPDLNIQVWTGQKINTKDGISVGGNLIFKYKNQDLMLVGKKEKLKDIFNYPRLLNYIQEYNSYVYNIYNS
jgi:hypothetical protein